MNTKELNNLLSTLLADSSNNFYTQTERLQALNSACNHVNSELRILMNVAEVVVSPLDARIPLPADFISLGKGVQWRDSRGQVTNLSSTGPAQLQFSNSTTWQTEKGTPTKYVMEGGNIFLTPQPSTSGTVVLSYLSRPNVLVNDTDTPFYGDPRTQPYHEMLAFYAAWLLVLKDRDFEAADRFQSFFSSRMVDLRENMRQTGDAVVVPIWSNPYST